MRIFLNDGNVFKVDKVVFIQGGVEAWFGKSYVVYPFSLIQFIHV